MTETIPNAPASADTTPASTSPPVAARIPVERTHHGDTFVDHYEWLRDKDSEQTRTYLEAENAYTAAQTAHLGDLREQIFGEIKSRTKETDLSVPTRTGSFWYYSRTNEGQQYPVLYRLSADEDDWNPPALEAGTPVDGEVTLVDCNTLAEGQEFFSLGAFEVSLDQRLLAYSTDVVGDERFTIRILDIETGLHLADEIPNTLHGATWSADGSHLFYSTVDESWRPDTVWRHRLGDAGTTSDVTVFHEADDRYWLSVSRTTSDRFILLDSSSRITSEVRVLDAAAPEGEPRILFPRETGVEYGVDHAVVAGQDHWIVLHNKGSLDFAIGIGGLDAGSIEALDPLVAHTPGVRLTDVHVSAEAIVVGLRDEGLAQVRVFPIGPDGIESGENIAFDETEFTSGADGFNDWRCPLVRITYASWLTPRTVLDYDPRTRTRLERKRQEVNGYDPSQFVQRREWVRSRDGVDIPLSIVHHRDVVPQSQSPLVLYGYGSYEISADPRFQISALSLLERGFVYATAHVRGGGEMGRQWYEDGKLLRKVNTFNDFVDCGRFLVDTGWTTPERLAAHGGSAGGLLMGAIANQAPDLFGAVVAHVPFVDALTTILDPSLPLTVIEWDEWGDPLHDADVYAYMKSYTPYENVEATAYPAIYAITSINDTRVYYVEPAKWIAQLRHSVKTDKPILLKCEMSAGHGGASGRYDFWRETADYLSWVVDTVGSGHDPRHRVG